MDLAPAVHLATINAVLRVAARHTSLLQREAWDAVADALAPVIPFGARGVGLFHPGTAGGLAALARGGGAASIVPPGGTFLGSAALDAALERGLSYRCDDMRLGSELERRAAEAGVRSYLALPIRRPGAPPGRLVGELVFGFSEVAGADLVPARLAEEVAAILGANIERALASTRDRRLAMILETSGDAMLAWDLEGRVTDANAAASALTGLAREALIGAPIRDLLHPMPDPTAGASPAQGRRLELCSSGRRVIVSASITPVDDDPLVAAHALLRDLSGVVAAEREAAQHLARVRALEEQHRSLLDNAPLIIFRLHPESAELEYLNRYAERLLGVPTGEALATPGFLRGSHATAEGLAAFDEAYARARSKADALPYEARLRRRDGAELTARGALYPLVAEDGAVRAIEGVLADVSVEHAARTRLVQADRLSTLGTLAAGVAHEINNPAAFILLGLDMLDRLLKGPGVRMEDAAAASAGELVGELRDSIKRIVDIARDLRLFASPPAPEGRRAVVDVNRTVESALTLTRGQILERARVVVELEPVPPVLMDDGRLGQVIVNLLVNAAQAIPRTLSGDDSVTIATRSDGTSVEVEVTDSGLGISEENLPRIWTPFFTTKSADVGTGLGLSISREIVERAGGSIRVESPAERRGGVGLPRGSRFTITLPAAGRGEAVAPVKSPLPKISSTRARVLVIEDEPALARALAEELGLVHDVDVAGGGPAALALLATKRFDAVLCDLRMPGTSGEALFSDVEARDPAQAARFVFMTGVGFGADVERFLAAAGRPVLEKPFATGDALEVIAKVIARARVPVSR